MNWTFYTVDSTSYTNYSNTSSTTANDYFSDWTRTFTNAGTGTTISPYSQSYVFYPVQQPLHIVEDVAEQRQRRIGVERRIGEQEVIEQRQVEQRELSQPPQKSPEQIKEEADAIEKAKNLLLEYLDDDNRQKFLEKKHLEIGSKLFDGIKYHIPLSKSGRIKAWRDDNVITELCLVVKEVEGFPIEDIILTKLLHIMNDEVNMLKMANHFNMKENLRLKAGLS